MRKFHNLLIITLILEACSLSNKKETNKNVIKKEFAIYSNLVQDSFFISVQLPEEYYKDPKVNFPTVFMIDANFYFPMMAPVLAQYEKGELLPPIILIGIGYKSFKEMDSLRVRDYLYPAAIPSDEMKTVGGGKKFDEFIVNQLVPFIDSNYHTDKSNRTLMGHSFGVCFTLYALLNQIETNRSDFKNIISASPSLWYNKFYLDQLTNKLKNRSIKDSLNIFLSVGGLEDSTWDILPVKKLSAQINKAAIKDINFKYRIYNELGHMDVGVLTFTKGLQECFNKQDKK